MTDPMLPTSREYEEWASGDPDPTDDRQELLREALEAWLDGDDGRREDVFGLWIQGKRDTAWVVNEIADDIAAIVAETKGDGA